MYASGRNKEKSDAFLSDCDGKIIPEIICHFAIFSEEKRLLKANEYLKIPMLDHLRNLF